MAMRRATLDAAVEGMGDEPLPAPAAPPGDDYGPDAEHKAAFLEMCEAIRAGDDETAWEAYQTCKELG